MYSPKNVNCCLAPLRQKVAGAHILWTVPRKYPLGALEEMTIFLLLQPLGYFRRCPTRNRTHGP